MKSTFSPKLGNGNQGLMLPEQLTAKLHPILLHIIFET